MKNRPLSIKDNPLFWLPMELIVTLNLRILASNKFKLQDQKEV